MNKLLFEKNFICLFSSWTDIYILFPHKILSYYSLFKLENHLVVTYQNSLPQKYVWNWNFNSIFMGSQSSKY